jgi:hypothetical protein
VTEDMDEDIPRLRNRWLRTTLRTQWVGVISLVITLASFIAYCVYNFYKPDALVVYFRFTDPKEVGTNQLHLNYIFSNAGKNPVFIEDVNLTEVFYQSKENDGRTIPSTDICKDPNIQTPALVAFLPPEVNSQPVVDANGRYNKLYTPKTIYLGSVQSPFSSLNIDVGAQRAISAIYEMDAVDWNKFNVVLLCPIIRFFDSSGHQFTAICDGFQSDQFPVVKGGQKETRATSGTGGLEGRLLPTSGSNCRITPF